MGLYVCRECGRSWSTHEEGICDSCNSPLPGEDACPRCGSEHWTPVDMGEELFYLIRQGLSPARSLYYYLNEVHDVSVKDIAELCDRTESSVYNVITNAEESLEDG